MCRYSEHFICVNPLSDRSYRKFTVLTSVIVYHKKQPRSRKSAIMALFSVITICHIDTYYSIPEGHIKRSGFLCPLFLLPSFILIWRILNTLFPKLFYHIIKLRFPHFFEPNRRTKPFYKCGTNGIISINKGSSVPCLCKSIVTIAAKCPNLRAIIGTVDGCSYITTVFL